MFKMFVSKAVKAAWENALTGSPEDASPSTRSSVSHSTDETEATEEVAITPQDLGIELPYYPGEGTSCGAECRCSWEIDIRFSSKHGGNAIFATWKSKDDSQTCADCQERARTWNNEFIRLQPD